MKLDRKSGEKVGVEGVVEARVGPRKRGSRYSARRWKLFQTVPGSCLYERPFPVVRLDEIARKTTF